MLAFLGLIPILLLLHKLRPKPKRMEVTNLFLWQEILQERAGKFTLRKLKKNIPLILQMGIIILAAVALARPVWTYLGQKRGDIILVMDTSGSMKARSGSITRFEQALKEARHIIDRLRNDQKILIIEAGREPRILSGFLEDRKRASELLEAIVPTDEPGDLEKALYLALSFLHPDQEDTLYLITDGAGCDFGKIRGMHPRIVPILVSGGANNQGITKFEFREEPERPNHYEVMLEVKNFNGEPVECPVSLTMDHTRIYEDDLRLDALERQLLIIPYHGISTGILTASLGIEDDFPTDNHAYLSLSAARDIWVLLVSKGNYYLEKMLEAYPNIMVNSMKEITPSSWEEQTRRHDIVIIDRMDFPETQRGNFLLIDSYSPSIPVERNGTARPGDIYWDRHNPIMENVDMGGLIVQEASVLKAGRGMKPLMESPQTGLMYSYEKNALRAVFLGFDIERSDLPLRLAFPVIMGNIINWLSPNKLHSSTMKTQAGDPIELNLLPDTTEIMIKAPNEKSRKYQVTQNPFPYPGTEQVGIYSLSEKDKRRYFTVNLVDELESDIQSPVIKNKDFERSGRTPGGEEAEVSKSLWALCIFLVFWILFLEWYFWLKTG